LKDQRVRRHFLQGLGLTYVYERGNDGDVQSADFEKVIYGVKELWPTVWETFKVFFTSADNHLPTPVKGDHVGG
jgi:hypothetical protein